MNAPAKIMPAREKYALIVQHHCPSAQGEELSLRCSILLLRDKATSNARHCADEAAPILHEIERLATLYAYSNIPTDELKELRYRLLQLTQTASGLNMFAYRLSGGADASGR